VFARFGRSDAEGAFATCHSLGLPPSEPGYYFWRDRASGRITRRSEWFVTKSPEVRIGATKIKYLISFVLPRFCEQSLARSWKRELYGDAESWVAKLDTIVHELYHIDPEATGIRQVANANGSRSRLHGPDFYREVVGIVKSYLSSKPNPAIIEFLQSDFAGLEARYGGVVATTFRNFPSFPRRYIEVCTSLPVDAAVKLEPLKPFSQPALYTEDDLHVRQFTDSSTRRLTRKGQHRAA